MTKIQNNGEDIIRISVIIPMYNVEKYIEECIESVLNQNFSGIEIICVDDCSTDLTLKKIDKYMEKIILIKNSENKGLSYSRNKGFQKAKGEYVYFLDSDDMIKPGMFSFLYPHLVNKDLDAIFFGGENRNELKENKNSILVDPFEFQIRDTPEFTMTGKELLMNLVNNGELLHCVVLSLWNRKTLIKMGVGFIENIIHEDVHWTILNLSKATRVCTVHKEFYVRRVRENSITTVPHTWHKLESYFVILYYFEQYYLRLDDEMLCAVFKKIINDLTWQARRVYERLKKENKISERKNSNLTQSIKNFIDIKLLQIKSTQYIDDINPEIINKIRSFSNVYLYGAGNVARDCIEILSLQGVSLSGVLVTNLDKNPKTFFCHKVMTPEKVKAEDYVILIAVKNHRDTIEKNLLEYDLNSFVHYTLD